MSNQTKDYTTARYWAISGIGYGRGFTPEEAESNYVEQLVVRDFRHLHRTRKVREEIVREEFPADLYKAPEEADGFRLGFGGLTWTKDGDPVRRATDDDWIR